MGCLCSKERNEDGLRFQSINDLNQSDDRDQSFEPTFVNEEATSYQDRTPLLNQSPDVKHVSISASSSSSSIDQNLIQKLLADVAELSDEDSSDQN